MYDKFKLGDKVTYRNVPHVVIGNKTSPVKHTVLGDLYPALGHDYLLGYAGEPIEGQELYPFVHSIEEELKLVSEN